MTFYHQQILLIRENVFPKEYLCNQVIRAKNFMDNHFAGNITLHDIAGEACYSKFHFLRLFKLIYGKTPHQYLTAVRIERAKQLLQPGLAVSEVCFSIGFDSVTSFKGLFKRYTNLTPAAYQKQLKNKPISQAPLKFLPFFFSLKKSNFQDRKKKSKIDLYTLHH